MKEKYLIPWGTLEKIDYEMEEIKELEEVEKKVDKFGKKCEKIGWEWIKFGAVLGLLTLALLLLPIIWRL